MSQGLAALSQHDYNTSLDQLMLTSVTHPISALQHYAVKTLENIASQGGDWAARLASAEAAACLVAIWQGSRADNLRATAASTLSRMLRHEPALLSLALDKYRSSLLVGGEALALRVLRAADCCCSANVRDCYQQGGALHGCMLLHEQRVAVSGAVQDCSSHLHSPLALITSEF